MIAGEGQVTLVPAHEGRSNSYVEEHFDFCLLYFPKDYLGQRCTYGGDTRLVYLQCLGAHQHALLLLVAPADSFEVLRSDRRQVYPRGAPRHRREGWPNHQRW